MYYSTFMYCSRSYEMYYRCTMDYNTCTMKCTMAIVRTIACSTAKNASTYYSHDVLRANTNIVDFCYLKFRKNSISRILKIEFLNLGRVAELVKRLLSTPKVKSQRRKKIFKPFWIFRKDEVFVKWPRYNQKKIIIRNFTKTSSFRIFLGHIISKVHSTSRWTRATGSRFKREIVTARGFKQVRYWL